MQSHQQITEDAWESATIEAILRFRTWALRCGTNHIKVWTMLSERVRMATAQESTIREWCSSIMHSFRIESVDPETGMVLAELKAVVGDREEEWLRFVEDSHQWILAAARLRFDMKKKAQAAKTPAPAKKPRARKAKKETPDV
jgi:hypothetical protein